MRKLFASIVICVLALSMSACSVVRKFTGGKEQEGTNTIVTGAEKLEDGREVNGYADGRIGDTMKTEWFAFTVNSVEFAQEYKDYKAAEGKELVIANMTFKNTFGDTLPMWSDEFQIQWGDTEEDYGFGIEPFDEAMMPKEFELAKGESYTGDLVYEIPTENSGEYSISFLEVYEDEVEGNVFFVYFEKDK